MANYTWKFLQALCIVLSVLEFGVSNWGYNGGGGQYHQRQRYQEKPKRNLPKKEDFYKILNIPHRSDYKTVKKAFKKLALQQHPDKVAESEKDEAKIRFELVTEAYTILSDPDKKAVYDQSGQEGLADYDEQQQHNDQMKAQQDIFKERREKQILAQNLFEDTDVLTISIDTLTRFYRRINVWIIFFYKGDEEQAAKAKNIYVELAQKYYGIFQVAAINCSEEEEICEEFEVNKTPVLNGYKSDSASPVHFENISSLSVGKLAMFAVNMMDDFVRIVTDGTYNDFAGKNTNKLKQILFTEKKVTPPIFKCLSKEFRNTVDFGIIKSSADSQIQNFGVTTYPQVISLTSQFDYKGDLFEEKITKDNLVDFIRKKIELLTDNTQTLNKLDEVKIIDESNYKLGFCGIHDTAVCVLLIANYSKDYVDIITKVQRKFSEQKMNFFIADRSNIDQDISIDKSGGRRSTSNDTANFNDSEEYVEMLIIKGTKKKYSYYLGYGDEESIANSVEMGMSQPFKRLKADIINSWKFEKKSSEENDL